MTRRAIRATEQNEEYGLFSVFFNDTEIIFPANLIWPHNTLIWSDNLDRKRTGEVLERERIHCERPTMKKREEREREVVKVD